MDQISEFVVNNLVLFAALIVILFLLARTWVGTVGIKRVGPMEAVSLSNHKAGVFIDVRTDKEYQQGHILHCLHAPLGLFESKLKEISPYKNRPLIVYCRSGNRSNSAAAMLIKQGYEEVYNLAGGVMAWQNANLPLTKDTSRPPKDNTPSPDDDSNSGSTPPPAQEGGGNSSPSTPNNNESTTAQKRQAEDEKIVVYTTQKCPFCVRAVDLLNDKGVGYKEINIENNPSLRAEMEQKAKCKTVPQIFINDMHVGGCDDMYELEDKGKLDPLLGLK